MQYYKIPKAYKTQGLAGGTLRKGGKIGHIIPLKKEAINIWRTSGAINYAQLHETLHNLADKTRI